MVSIWEEEGILFFYRLIITYVAECGHYVTINM